MKTELQMDIIHIAVAFTLAIISKVFGTSESTLFAFINLISLILFTKGVINFIEDKYNVRILKNINKETISQLIRI